MKSEEQIVSSANPHDDPKPFDFPVGLSTERANDFLAPTHLPRTLSSLLLFKDTAYESIIKIVAEEIRQGVWGYGWQGVFSELLARALDGYMGEEGPAKDLARELGKKHKKELFVGFCDVFEDFSSRLLKQVIGNHYAEAIDDGPEKIDLETSGLEQHQADIAYLLTQLFKPAINVDTEKLAAIRRNSDVDVALKAFYRKLNQIIGNAGFGSYSLNNHLVHCWLNNQAPEDLYYQLPSVTISGVIITDGRLIGHQVASMIREYDYKTNAIQHSFGIPSSFMRVLR